VQLLERGASLAALAGYAREARQRDGRLVLVAGEAGVGKSALLEQLQDDLPDARWSWGACDGLFTPRPLGPLFDLAGQLGGELDDLCRAGAAREDLFRALLRQVSGRGTLSVLVVEDVHWADEATVDLLRFLGRRLRDAPVLLIATYRGEDLAADDPLRAALGEIARQRSTRRMDLGALSADAVRILADGTGLDAAELYRLTSGNPFYVTEVVQAGLGVVPASARDAVLARAARLGGGSREVLDIAALTGARVELDLLESVTACPPAAVDEVLASGLLAEDGGWLRFRHEIARLAVEQAVAPHRRAPVHARILAALGLRGCDDDARMAFHAEAAGDRARVLHHAPRAACQAAELGSHREGAAQFERALRWASGAGPGVAGLYDGLARELRLVGRYQGAVDAGEQALGLWRQAGDRLREGGTLRALSYALLSMGRGPEAVAAGEAAVTVLEPLGPTVELARAYARLASARMRFSEHQAAIELAERAQVIAEPLGALNALSDALITRGSSVAYTGGEWTAFLRRALDVALSAGLDDEAGRAFANLYNAYAGRRRFAEADRYFTDGVVFCDEHDLDTYTIFLRGERAVALERTGRWDEAVALSAELLASADLSSLYRLHPLHVLGVIRARRREPGAWEHLDEAAARADACAEPQWIIPVRLARAEAYWLQGDPDPAAREAELADDAEVGSDGWERGEIAVWLRRTGSPRPPRGELAGPYRLQVAGGDGQEAARLWAGLGCRYEAALALHDAGGEAALRQALEIFTGLGAPAAAQLTRREMRRLGVRSIPAGPRTATQADPLGLTRREREVLNLICAGHSNAGIAAKLFLSAKTVDHHVSAVLAKLGTPTREAAAAHAARPGAASAAEI
jgi:DNA-binding CsgD family transcriptional regulator/tetratricopeptide (TPR) repeat protein